MKTPKAKYRQLGVSFLSSTAMLLIALLCIEAITSGILIDRLLIPLARLIFFICIGLFAGQVIEALGWTRQVAVLARPFFRFSRMGDHCGAAFITAFLSGATANALLLDFYQERKISKFQLFLSNYLNQFPAFFLHLPTTMFIVLPLTGRAGALYFLLTFLATLIRTIICLLCGRIFLDHKSPETEGADRSISGSTENSNPKWNDVKERIKKRLFPRIINILVWVLPIYTAVFILHITGSFDALNQLLSSAFSSQFLPIESISVIILSFAAEFTSGFAAAGALMDAGVLSVKQTVVALLMGNILAFPIRALRHQLPRYMGIFSPKLGLQLLLSGQFFRIVSLIFVGLIYYFGA